MSSDYSSVDLQQWLTFLAVMVAGFALGLLFFGSLWLSTGKILRSRHPVGWVLGGFLLRLALVLPAIYWAADAHWLKLLVCLAGFIVARASVIKVTASKPQKETGHAS